MSVEVRFGGDVSKSYESVFFREFAEAVKAEFERENIDAFLLGMPYCKNKKTLQIDALLVTKSKIVIVEFKDYGGTIGFINEGSIKKDPWKISEITINRDSENPFQQTRAQRSKLAKQFDSKEFNYSYADINVMVCFQQEVTFENGDVRLNDAPWFFVSDCTNYCTRLLDIARAGQDKGYLSADSKEKLLRIFSAAPYKIKGDAGENQGLAKTSDAKLLEQLCLKLSAPNGDPLPLYRELFGKSGDKRAQFFSADDSQSEIARQVLSTFGIGKIDCSDGVEPSLSIDDSKKVFEKLKEFVSSFTIIDQAEVLKGIISAKNVKRWATYAKEGCAENFLGEVSLVLSKATDADSPLVRKKGIKDAWALAFLGAIVGPGNALRFSQNELTKTSDGHGTLATVKGSFSDTAKTIWSLEIIGCCENGLDNPLMTLDLPPQTVRLKIGRPSDINLCYKTAREAAINAKIADDTLLIPFGVVSREHAQLNFQPSKFMIQNMSLREQSTAVLRREGDSLSVEPEDIAHDDIVDKLGSGSVVLLAPRAFPEDKIKGFAIRVVKRNL